MKPTKYGSCPKRCLDGMDSYDSAHPLIEKDGHLVLSDHKGFAEFNTKNGLCAGSGMKPKRVYPSFLCRSEAEVSFLCSLCAKQVKVTFDKVKVVTEDGDEFHVECPSCKGGVTVLF